MKIVPSKNGVNKTVSSKQRGFSLLLAIIIAGVGLSIGLTMLSITVKQLDLNTTARDSEIAFRVASAGMECLAVARYDVDHNYADGDEAVIPDYDCLDNSSFTLTTSDSASEPIRVYESSPSDMNWIVDGIERCVDMQLRVYKGGASGIMIDDIPTRLTERECPAGANCYVGIVRGYNRSCADVGSGSVMAVERELTVEF